MRARLLVRAMRLMEGVDQLRGLEGQRVGDVVAARHPLRLNVPIAPGKRGCSRWCEGPVGLVVVRVGGEDELHRAVDGGVEILMQRAVKAERSAVEADYARARPVRSR